MNREIFLTIICGLLVASLATPAAAVTTFTSLQDLVIPSTGAEASDDVILDGALVSPTTLTSVGVNTIKDESVGTLKAKLLVDVDGDGDFSDVSPDILVETDWGESNIAETSFYCQSSQTPIRLFVTGNSAGTVELYTNQGSAIDTTKDAIKSAKVTLGVSVPEFPTIALPIASILGLIFIFGRKKEGL